MGVLLGYDGTNVDRIRVGVLDDNFRNIRHPVKENIVSTTARKKETAIPMMDSSVRIEEDMCGFLTKKPIEQNKGNSVVKGGDETMRASRQINRMRTRMKLSRLWIASLQKRIMTRVRGPLHGADERR